MRAIEDPALVAELADRRIPLEICPVSNVATGVYEDVASVPLPALRDAGVVVTLNSDDPSMFDAWLTDVYVAARDAWQLTDAELADLARAAVAASFADDDVKSTVRTGIDAWLAAPVAPAHEPAVP